MTVAMGDLSATDSLYLRDAYLRVVRATVVAVRDGAVALDRTRLLPHRRRPAARHGRDRWGDASSTSARTGGLVWHVIDGEPPAVGDDVDGEVDWDRRHALMRTHTALHVLCGVIWNEWRRAGDRREHGAAGGPHGLRVRSAARGLRPAGRAARQRRARRPTVRSRCRSCPRDTALEDDDLIRTKVNLIPESVTEIRVVDIVGLDKQADGGTHVRSTGEVGRIRVVKTESKGKGNKRIRLEVVDAGAVDA